LIENRLVEEKIMSEEKEEKDSKCFGIGCLFEMQTGKDSLKVNSDRGKKRKGIVSSAIRLAYFRLFGNVFPRCCFQFNDQSLRIQYFIVATATV
jgi:hypothetical protein